MRNRTADPARVACSARLEAAGRLGGAWSLGQDAASLSGRFSADPAREILAGSGVEKIDSAGLGRFRAKLLHTPCKMHSVQLFGKCEVVLESLQRLRTKCQSSFCVHLRSRENFAIFGFLNFAGFEAELELTTQELKISNGS